MTNAMPAKDGPFKRTIGRDVDARLEKLSQHGWWKDLLTLWKPAGYPSGEYGLRLAIRNGTMNFYRKGQSIAKVGFDKDREPYLELHLGYVKATSGLGDHHVRVYGHKYSCRTLPEEIGRYEGGATLRQWIKNAENIRVREKEKEFVDQLLDATPNAIDMEMALPGFRAVDSARESKRLKASADKKIAIRVDLVTLESNTSGASIVFWEAKMMDNDELRCNGEKDPELFGQIKDYKYWLSREGRVAQVATAYQETCEQLVAIHAQAIRLGLGVGQLGDVIRSVAEKKPALQVDCCPRVVIGDQDQDKSWEENGHARKLEDAEYFVQVVHGEANTDFALKSKA